MPLLQERGEHSGHGHLIVRADGGGVNADGVRRAVESLHHESILWYRTLEGETDLVLLKERVTAMLAGFFGVLALALAAIGLYGLMAYAVTQRTREIGIRVALGAQVREVLGMIMRETLMLVGTGIALGTPIALVASRIVASLLFRVAPTDTTTLVLIAAVLLAIGGLAAYLPGRRAAASPVVFAAND